MPCLDEIARATLDALEADGLLKREREIVSPQSGSVRLAGQAGARKSINLCANNYLGLADHPQVLTAAAAALESHGFGMASVRFICGTQDLHRALEQATAHFLGKDDAILFAACFDANAAVFETLLGADDAVISDALNHASIIDGIRLSKAKRYRYANGDMDALEDALKQADADGARQKLIVSDGVFSMDGHVAKLPEIAALARTYGAAVMIDECHATGHLGATGRGTAELTGAGLDAADIITGTYGKTLGGGMGGFIAGSRAVIGLLRQRARPYLFSNALAPPMTAGALKALKIAAQGDDLRARLNANTAHFRCGLTAAGFELIPGQTPIIPVMLGEAKRAQALAAALDQRGVFVAGFFYPVVPHGKARIRTQVSAALGTAELDHAIAAFADAGRQLGFVGG
jgi:glycine C-acetyltransferase